jgi:hypothetical protein
MYKPPAIAGLAARISPSHVAIAPLPEWRRSHRHPTAMRADLRSLASAIDRLLSLAVLMLSGN